MPLNTARALEDQKRARTARGRAALGAFGVEGVRLVRRGLRAGWRPRHLLVAESQATVDEVRTLCEQVPSWGVVSPQELKSLAQGRASGEVQALFELPSGQGVRDILAKNTHAVFLVLFEVEEPGNVGALIRTALASGADAVICAGGTDPFHPKAVRTSLGSLFRMPLIAAPELGAATEGSTLESVLCELHSANVHTVATVPRGGEALCSAALPSKAIALVVGHEGQGIPVGIQAQCRQKVSIEQSSDADSYSVNAAAAICLFDILRRRRVPFLTLPADLTRQGES